MSLTEQVLTKAESFLVWDDNSVPSESKSRVLDPVGRFVSERLGLVNAPEENRSLGLGTIPLVLDWSVHVTATSAWAEDEASTVHLARTVNYTDTYFEKLAATNPTQLISLIRGGHLRPSDLTFAAEILGREVRSAAAYKTLLSLLGHPAPLVREGAIYGIFHYLDSSEARKSLEILSLSDPSPGVRAAAQDMLDI